MPNEWQGQLDTSDTLLRISGFGTMLYQARGLTQTIEPIKASQQLERTVNAALVDISNPAFRKYTSKITCTDVHAPPLDNVWPGMQVTVDCAVALCFVTGTPGSPARPLAAGSNSWTVGAFTFYRPQLIMRVVHPSEQFEEWPHNVVWELELEEV
jgi:hypothetical protein